MADKIVAGLHLAFTSLMRVAHNGDLHWVFSVSLLSFLQRAFGSFQSLLVGVSVSSHVRDLSSRTDTPSDQS